MSILDRVYKTVSQAPRITLYGKPGVGKTTLASTFPEPLFLLTEDNECPGINALPIVKSYDENDKIINVKHDGQSSQEIGRFNATFITKSSFSVNTKKYKEVEHEIPTDINPVKTSVSYRVSNSGLDTFLERSSLLQQEILSKCLDMKYSVDIKLAPRKR